MLSIAINENCKQSKSGIVVEKKREIKKEVRERERKIIKIITAYFLMRCRIFLLDGSL